MASLIEPAAAPLLSLRDVSKVYGEGEAAVRALDGVSLDIERGELVAITGSSGSGKSTAVSILGCLELPTDGSYLIEGIPVQELSADVLAALRNARFGFVFQQFNLLARTSAVENVALPLSTQGSAPANARRAPATRWPLSGSRDARPRARTSCRVDSSSASRSHGP